MSSALRLEIAPLTYSYSILKRPQDELALTARYDRHLSERWSLGASAAVFALNFAEDELSFEGELWSVRLHAEYRFARNFALGVALDGFSVNVDVSQEAWNGGFDYGYWGPQVYLAARF